MQAPEVCRHEKPHMSNASVESAENDTIELPRCDIYINHRFYNTLYLNSYDHFYFEIQNFIHIFATIIKSYEK